MSVAYPLAPVGPDAAGGAEQVLSMIDRALVASGHRSRVIACEGSDVAGDLLPVPAVSEAVIDGTVRGRAHRAIRDHLREASASADVVHLHGVDFDAYLPPPGPAALATLHLPPSWYSPAALRPERKRTALHCVSASQHAACPDDLSCLLPPVENGVPVEVLGAVRHGRRGFALTLGRICPEKGQHRALEAARLADAAILVAGPVFPYGEHLAYLADEIRPRLGRKRRLIGPLDFRRKRRFLAAASCLLVPSLAPETSSLVAMEALSCGTPVIAWASGALPEIVDHGVTGLIVDDVEAMADAIGKVGAIDRATCRRVAAERFDARRMTASYLALYERLAA